jgi:HNH endonuclease
MILPARILDNIAPLDKNGHERWWGKINRAGYGRTTFEGKEVMVHRLIWEHECGPIPEGMEMHHECGVKNCVTIGPGHLVLVLRESHSGHMAVINRAKMQCVNGHQYTAENTVWDKGKRNCRKCRQAVARRRYEARMQRRRNHARTF